MLYFLGWLVVASAIIGVIIGRAYERDLWRQRLLDRTGLVPGEPKRLTDAIDSVRGVANPDPVQLAQALDAIAVEVERIGEGQRFLTKLLAERENRSSANKAPSPVPGSVRSPIPPNA